MATSNSDYGPNLLSDSESQSPIPDSTAKDPIDEKTYDALPSAAGSWAREREVKPPDSLNSPGDAMKRFEERNAISQDNDAIEKYPGMSSLFIVVDIV